MQCPAQRQADKHDQAVTLWFHVNYFKPLIRPRTLNPDTSILLNLDFVLGVMGAQLFHNYCSRIAREV